VAAQRRALIVAAPIVSLGGGIRHCAAVARALCDRGWDVELLVVGRVDEAAGRALVLGAAPRAALTIHGKTGVWAGAAVWQAVRRAERRGLDTIYAPFPQGLIAAAYAHAAPRTRLVAGVQGALLEEGLPRWKRRLYRVLLRRALSRCRAAAGVSEHALIAAAARFDLPSRRALVGNVAFGIGDAPWVGAMAADGPARAGSSAVVIARLAREKGVDIAIHALAKTTGLRRLDVYGDGPERAALQALADRLGVADRVRFHGWADGADVVRRRPLVIIPSRSEGFSLVLLEAAWAGCSIIASDVGGIPELARDLGGVTLIDPESAERLAEAWDAVDGGGARADGRDLRRWSWPTFSERVSEVFDA
jgi:glycosyltransferase involved in cell wall biosynthesis